MSSPYDPSLFKTRLAEKLGNTAIKCPFCGKTSLTISTEYASLFVQKDLKSLQLGRNIPCGIISCNNCGHTNLFALGVLGMMAEQNSED